MTTMIKMAPS